MKQFLKTVALIAVKSVILTVVMAMFFSAGYISRPYTVKELPKEVARYIGEKEVKTLDGEDFKGTRVVMAVMADGGIEQIDPTDLRSLMRADIRWIVDINLIRTGNETITVIEIDVPIDGKTLTIFLKLRGVESYSLTTVKNEMPEVATPSDEDAF